MKSAFLLLSTLLSLSAIGGVTIVSDFDDTIKRSNIPAGGLVMTGNSVLYKKAYRGIPTLYKAMEENATDLYVLSASPSAIKPFIKCTLAEYGIPYRRIFTRPVSALFSESKKMKYKINRIESVMSDEDQLLLLGDNVEVDHDIYKTIKAKHPGKVADIYIRMVLNKDIPADIVKFYTAFEIAANEYQKNRLTMEQVQDVASAILDTREEKMYQLIPAYASCPTEVAQFTQVKVHELKDVASKVFEKVVTYCKDRKIKEALRAAALDKLIREMEEEKELEDQFDDLYYN
ncbi:MAG: DUF2183 domain-containing protein [Halobacteriovoraceae bacterium]|jgi:hypothetical protein|nr:DUF2183 domain-containing protein [Halobacteriovoraceae bacterium]